MGELVADCPRCDAKNMTFDVHSACDVGTPRYHWERWFEAFSICRRCHSSTVFLLIQKDIEHAQLMRQKEVPNLSPLNKYFIVNGYIGLKNLATTKPPDHVPKNIANAFNEAATCMAVDCFNAAAAMFRLCIDHATTSLLPSEDADGLNARIRRSLGLRLPWLFDHNLLPEGLRELSHCIKEDGNDAAHAGTLLKTDAEDLLDFTRVLLERLYTEPEQLRLAKERRDKRRGTPSGSPPTP